MIDRNHPLWRIAVAALKECEPLSCERDRVYAKLLADATDTDAAGLVRAMQRVLRQTYRMILTITDADGFISWSLDEAALHHATAAATAAQAVAHLTVRNQP